MTAWCTWEWPALWAPPAWAKAWAFAKIGSDDAPALLHNIAREIEQRALSTFNNASLVNMVWALASARVDAPSMLSRVRAEVAALPRLSSFEPRELATAVRSSCRAERSIKERASCVSGCERLYLCGSSAACVRARP